MKVNKVVESNTSRIFQHLTDVNTCGIISAYRGENPLKTNKTLQNNLKKDVRNLGLGFIEFTSRWVEDGESFDEESLLIPQISKEDAIKLGKKYDQASIIFKDSEKCVEICTTPFESYQNGDVVRVYNNVGPGMLNISDAEEIFARKKGGPASGPKKGGKPFTLKVIEKVAAKPSIFRGPSENVIFEKLYNEAEDNETLLKKIDKFIDDVYMLRKTSIMSDGEYGEGNLVFKELRNNGYLDKLKELKTKLTELDMIVEDIDLDEELLDEIYFVNPEVVKDPNIKNFITHYYRHNISSEDGGDKLHMTPEEYNDIANSLSESEYEDIKLDDDRNLLNRNCVVGYKTKNGRGAKYDLNTGMLVVFVDNVIVSLYKMPLEKFITKIIKSDGPFSFNGNLD